MKKILCVLMAALLLMGTAIAEEEFTLHNGTKFGMTFDEVIETEKSKGFSLEQKDSGGDILLFGSGVIANQNDSKLWYHFTNGLLSQLEYSFPLDAFDTIETGLIDKYGTTEYNSETGKKYPVIRSWTEITTEHQVPDYKDVEKYSSRVIAIGNDSYVYIQHYIKIYPDLNMSFHYLSYYLISQEEADKLLVQNEGSDDL